MRAELQADILRRLEEFRFKPAKGKGKWLQGGQCPACHKHELYVDQESPWVVRCGRLDKCGYEGHVKELYPDLFSDWSTRAAPRMATNPNAAADDYLEHARGFKLDLIKGWYRQESYYDPKADNGKGAGSATVRFQVGETFWERSLDRPERFGKKKAHFKYGASYQGTWWCPPDLTPHEGVSDLYLVEGIFDALAMRHNNIAAVALLSCNNYPEQALAELRKALAERGTSVRLVWALDSDKAGINYPFKWVERCREEGWECTAAQIPQRGNKKTDWNDLHQHGKLGLARRQQHRFLGRSIGFRQ